MDLSGTDFRDSILTDANFTVVTLHDSGFDKANIGGAVFYGADLRRAQITSRGTAREFPEELPVSFPDFNCADLEGADFTDTLFFGIVGDETFKANATGMSTGEGWFSYPFLRSANLAHAKLARIRIFIVMPAIRHVEGREFLQTTSSELPFEGAEEFMSHELSQPQPYSRMPRSVVTVIETGADLRVKEPVDAKYSFGIYAALGQLASARNIEQADLSPNIKEFIQRNKRSLLGRGYQASKIWRTEPCDGAKSLPNVTP